MGDSVYPESLFFNRSSKKQTVNRLNMLIQRIKNIKNIVIFVSFLYL